MYGPVPFNVSCYGYMCREFDFRPDLAYGERDPHHAAPFFAYSATYPQPGCVIYQPFYGNHRLITWCEISGLSCRRMETQHILL